MTYAAIVGNGGYTGWRLLERTADAQIQAVAKEPQMQISRDHFMTGAENVKSADDLVSDYRMLKVALTAFGLEGDLRNKAFIKKVLESDLTDEKSFVNKLGDKRYLKLAEALGLGGKNSASGLTYAESVFDSYVEATFQIRVGDQDGNLRLALNAQKELAALAESATSENSFWYMIIGSKPLRAVFEGAFGLPSSFGRVSIDRQLVYFKDHAEKNFGTSDPKIFLESENVEKAIRAFLLRSQVNSSSMTNRFSAALILLSR